MWPSEGRQNAGTAPALPADAARLRRLATALLAVFAVLYALARTQEHTHWAWGFVRAFCEAAMIGGLADWFAVTAIFRRPFGLPIPHTGVIPRNKDRIGDSLAGFIATNFLGPDLVRTRLGAVDLVGAAARRLQSPAAADASADALMRAAPALLDTVDDAAISAFLRRQAQSTAVGAAVAPVGGLGVEAFLRQGRHHEAINAALREAWRLLHDHEPALRARVRENTGWLWRVIKLDERAADSMVRAIEDTMREAARDPDHPLRQRVAALLHRLAEDLRTAPALQARVQTILAELIAHPAAQAALEGAWRDMKTALAADAQSPDSKVRAALSGLIQALAEGLLEDAAARAALNERLTAAAADLAGRHGQDVAAVVSDTIRSWDAQTLSAKLEQGVGRDLQYIRLNGTLIGGLIGLALHALWEVSPF